ncbi:hypothetical protein [[Kitasatospora] papulosa]|uniref:hypothetical protein n=1 Tax=[Kitasatospora] papulosa TaxID=1464011 RepID=UPI0036CFA1B4
MSHRYAVARHLRASARLIFGNGADAGGPAWFAPLALVVSVLAQACRTRLVLPTGAGSPPGPLGTSAGCLKPPWHNRGVEISEHLDALARKASHSPPPPTKRGLRLWCRPARPGGYAT